MHTLYKSQGAKLYSSSRVELPKFGQSGTKAWLPHLPHPLVLAQRRSRQNPLPLECCWTPSSLKTVCQILFYPTIISTYYKYNADFSRILGLHLSQKKKVSKTYINKHHLLKATQKQLQLFKEKACKRNFKRSGLKHEMLNITKKFYCVGIRSQKHQVLTISSKTKHTEIS